VPKESIESAVMEMAAQVAANAPLTIRATKEMARRLMQARGPAQADADLIEMCYMSADFKEGVDAFLSKRKPRWTGA
jgi:enoyl-CoA hydratase/carnithine racemase